VFRELLRQLRTFEVGSSPSDWVILPSRTSSLTASTI